ncbi:hypothetical protein [Mesorhizobium sp.]|nr:hypothetical protein [Mesorhizobium sp.]
MRNGSRMAAGTIIFLQEARELRRIQHLLGELSRSPLPSVG